MSAVALMPILIAVLPGSKLICTGYVTTFCEVVADGAIVAIVPFSVVFGTASKVSITGWPIATLAASVSLRLTLMCSCERSISVMLAVLLLVLLLGPGGV